MSQKHIIARQIIDLEVPSAKNAFKIQQQFSELFKGTLLPVMEKVFDELVEKEMIVAIDKLEIDLGELDIEHLNKAELKEVFAKKITEEIQALLDQSSNKNSVKQSLHLGYFDRWLFWLKKGFLPFHHANFETNWQEKILEALAIENQTLNKLQLLLTNNRTALNRLILQHSNVFLQSIIASFTKESQQKLGLFIEELALFFNTKKEENVIVNFRKIETRIWLIIFEKTLRYQDKKTADEYCHLILNSDVLPSFFYEYALEKTNAFPIIRQLFVQNASLWSEKEVNQSIESKSLTNKISNKIKDSQAINNEEINADKKREIDLALQTEITNQIRPENDEELHEAAVNKNDLIQKTKALKESPKENNEEVYKEGLFIENAGIVLVHPFLSRFFDNLNLLKAGQFKNKKCQHKAVLLLHYLASKEVQSPDYQLALPKFLLGLPFNHVLDHQLKLTKKDQAAADYLLEAVVEHWGALGNTSPDGLRDGFLQRQGKLVKKQTGWKLLIEQKTLDILLDKLPWNLSLIKLPWMKEILSVEWR